MSHTPIFSKNYVTRKLTNFDQGPYLDADGVREAIEEWTKLIRSGVIDKKKEETIGADFLNAIFGTVLGYSYDRSAPCWNLEKEVKSATDGTKSDGALGYFAPDSEDVRVVIELKDSRTNLDRPQNRKNDRRTPVEQAFDYAAKTAGRCHWVVVSNFRELRLYSYQGGQSQYQLFQIADLDNPDVLTRFVFLMHFDHLIDEQDNAHTDFLYRERREQEKAISKKFYSEYKNLRISLFEHLQEYNPAISNEELLQLTQTILDRLLFTFFCEDTGLIPHYTVKNILDIARKSFDTSPTKIWDQLKGLFKSINSGNLSLGINEFDGGLFSDDTVIDQLIIRDDPLDAVLGLADYDFESDLNVNILGHIFEQSITDIEDLRSTFDNTADDKKAGRRKEEGIFYTPDYVTQFIVEKTIGSWLTRQRELLDEANLPELTEADYSSVSVTKKGVVKSNRNIKAHLDFLDKYQSRLSEIKVLDPSCGSGAFLIQAFDYLYNEGQKINDEIAPLRGGQRGFFDLQKHILSNNLYGVDLNGESIEITKLALWLKTADRGKKLTYLDSSIQVGNSLVDDPDIAGAKAFSWPDRFPSVFEGGGFDVVLGNPPWGAKLDQEELAFVKDRNRDIIVRMTDSFMFFLNQSLSLLNEQGYLGMILPDVILYQVDNRKLREKLVSESNPTEIINLGDGIFEGVARPSCILVTTRLSGDETHVGSYRPSSSEVLFSDVTVVQKEFFKDLPNSIFPTRYIEHYQLLKRLLGKSLVDYLDEDGIQRGVSPDLKDAFIVDSRQAAKLGLEREYLRRTVTGGYDVRRYFINDVEKLIIYTSRNVPEADIPSIRQFVESHEEDITCKEVRDGKHPIYALHRPRSQSIFTKSEKIVGVITGDRIIVALDDQQLFPTDGLYLFAARSGYDNRYLVAVLNSKLMTFLYRLLSMEKDRTLSQIKPKVLEMLPFQDVSRDDQNAIIKQYEEILTATEALEKERHRFLNVVLAELKLKKVSTALDNWHQLDWDDFEAELRKQKVKLDLHEKAKWIDFFGDAKSKVEPLTNQVIHSEEQLNRAVYRLYGLTEAEISVVESDTSSQ